MMTTKFILFTLFALSINSATAETNLQDKFLAYSGKEDVFVSDFNKDKFKFEGRWENKSKADKDPSKGVDLHFISDLPCSGLSFNIETENSDTSPTVTIRHKLVRTRVLITI